MGIIGNTHGVTNASNPKPIAVKIKPQRDSLASLLSSSVVTPPPGIIGGGGAGTAAFKEVSVCVVVSKTFDPFVIAISKGFCPRNSIGTVKVFGGMQLDSLHV